MTHAAAYRQIVAQLQDQVLSGRFPPGTRLPSEVELAASFGVSRVTLREALRILQHEGWVDRRHGTGTFVIGLRKPISAGLEKLESFTETIRRSGIEARDIVLEVGTTRITPPIARALGVTESRPACFVRTLRTAGEIPVIYCHDVISPTVVADPRALERRRESESLIDFLQGQADIELAFSALSVSAVRARGALCKILRVPRGFPLVLLQGPGYDVHSIPIYYSTNYVNSEQYQFTILRRR
jgi:GntR family transcriptional regulator